ncbi:MAG: phage BR0599 family protein [Rhodanobacter sp.]
MFETFELSRFLGRPVRLFRFERQGLVWRYCTSPQDLTIGGVTYLSAQIDRGEIKQTVERAKDKIKITFAYLRDPNAPTFPVTQDFGNNWNPYTPSDTMRVICMATHIGDTDPPLVEWMGVVAQPEFTDVELTLTCEPSTAIAAALQQGPKWQKGCYKTVYSTGPRGCGLDPAKFAISATLTAAAGLTMTAAEFATSTLTLAGGWLEWTRSDGLVERRSIMSHAGTSIGLIYGAADLAAGVAVVARPGCEQTWDACSARFPDPENHYGGAIYKPITPPDNQSMSWG